jgi:hypothetical protein
MMNESILVDSLSAEYVGGFMHWTNHAWLVDSVSITKEFLDG